MPDPVHGVDPAIKALSGVIAGAADARIKRIVAKVDAMAARGQADALIAPLRTRLGELRPTRPLRFARLLFLPLDPLIVPAARWNATSFLIPRTAIMPMAQVVETALAERAEAIKSAIRTRTTDDTDLISIIGKAFWPEAGAIMASAETSVLWQQTGLDQAVFDTLKRRIGAMLRQAPAMDSLCTEAAQGLVPPSRDAIEAMVRPILSAAPDALPMLATLLLTRLPQTAGVLYAIESGSAAAAIKAATDQAADHLLGQLGGEGESLIAANSLADCGAAAGRVLALLDELDRDDAPAARRKQVRLLRQRLDGDCKARFVAGMTMDLLAPMQTLPDQPSAAEVMKLEAAARGLRVLEAKGRPLGSGPAYDKMLTQAADAMREAPDDGGLALTDRVRLLEILAGSDAAMDLLDCGGRPG